jgi:hypothetical protein
MLERTRDMQKRTFTPNAAMCKYMAPQPGPAAYLAADTPSAPVPVATPWLIMLSRVGVVFLTARGFAADTALVTAALGAGTVMCCAALGSSWLRRGRERISEPGADRAQREAAAAGAGGRT